MEIKKIYRYSVCLASLLFVMWGCVEISAAAMHYIFPGPKYDISGQVQAPGADQKSIEPGNVDEYYRKRAVYDGVSEGLAKIIIPGFVFVYFGIKIKREEGV